MRDISELSHLPGADLVARGLSDLANGARTVEAWLVLIGAPRLRNLGFDVPADERRPEHELYSLLSEQHGNAAHSKYNALVRRLVSFERAASCVR